jgi:hypothetical protein
LGFVVAACALPLRAVRAAIASTTDAIRRDVIPIFMSPPFLGGRFVRPFADGTTSR